LNDSQRKVIRETYEEKGAKSLAEVLGLNRSTIQACARKLGLSAKGCYIRSAATKRARNTTVDFKYFNENGENKAYIAGYTWADGSISCKRKFVALDCKTLDEDIIRKVRWELKSKHKLTRLNSSKGRKPHTKCVISNTDLTVSLCDLYGIIPNKSKLDPAYPSLTAEDFPHFLRGYFDGDGTAGYSYYTVKFYGGERFIVGLRDEVLRVVPSLYSVRVSRAGEHLFGVAWQSPEDVRKLYEFMYPAGEYLYGLRKRRLLELQLGYPLKDPVNFEMVPKLSAQLFARWGGEDVVVVHEGKNRSAVVKRSGVYSLVPNVSLSSPRFVFAD